MLSLFPKTDLCRIDCSFDVNLCNWKQSKSDNMDWIRWSGSTPSPFTGPSFDHTTGCKWFISLLSLFLLVYKTPKIINNNRKGISALIFLSKQMATIYTLMDRHHKRENLQDWRVLQIVSLELIAYSFGIICMEYQNTWCWVWPY